MKTINLPESIRIFDYVKTITPKDKVVTKADGKVSICQWRGDRNCFQMRRK